jgi:hypothetical protein
MLLKTFLSIFLFAQLNVAFSQSDWELTKDKNGIKVFTSKDGASRFKTIKVEAVVNGTLQKLAQVLFDVGNTRHWVYGTKESYLIRKINANEILYYSETALPWPVSNRDIPIQMRMNVDGKNNTLKVVASGVPAAVPEKKGIVRIPFFNAFWDVKEVGKNKLFITYLLKMDPGGSVPAGLTNLFVAKGPYETFSNLSDLLR